MSHRHKGTQTQSLQLPGEVKNKKQKQNQNRWATEVGKGLGEKSHEGPAEGVASQLSPGKSWGARKLQGRGQLLQAGEGLQEEEA